MSVLLDDIEGGPRSIAAVCLVRRLDIATRINRCAFHACAAVGNRFDVQQAVPCNTVENFSFGSIWTRVYPKSYKACIATAIQSHREASLVELVDLNRFFWKRLEV